MYHPLSLLRSRSYNSDVACKFIPNYDRGRAIANQIISNYMHIALKNTLIDFYGKASEIDKAEKIYAEYFRDKERDIVTINAMMSAYVNSECYAKALALYDETRIPLNEISDVIAINAAGDLNDLRKGKEIHDKVHSIRNKCGELANAQLVFDTIKDSDKNIICMNAMLAAHCSNKADSQCIELFKEMIAKTTLKPTVTTYQILFRACTNGTAFYFGRQIHDKLKRNTHHKRTLNDVIVEMNLINMYSKCGMLDIAEDIFNAIRNPDISIWNAMIHGFGKIGNLHKAKQLYHINTISSVCAHVHPMHSELSHQKQI
eukprot:59223_1